MTVVGQTFVNMFIRDVTEDELEWKFTNKKKQGGGVVKSLKLDTDTGSAVIEFKDSSGKLHS